MRKKLAALSVLIFAVSVSATVTSLDKLEYQSQGSDFWDGPQFILSVTSDYDTNEFHFQLDNEADLATKLNPTSSVQNDITVDIKNQRTEAVYTLRSTGKKSVYKVEPFTDWFYPSDVPDGMTTIQYIESEYDEECVDLSGNGEFDSLDYYTKTGFNGWKWGYKHYCLTKGEPLGNVGEISSNPRDVFSTNWVVKNDQGVIDQATISNGDMGESVVQQIGRNVKVEFSGAAETGQNSPVPTDELALQLAGNTGFRIIQRDEYQEYRGSFDVLDQLKAWGRNNGVTGTDIASNINSKAVEAADQHRSSEFLRGSDPDNDGTAEVQQTSFTGSSFNNGELRLQISDLLYPQFQVAVRACRYSGDRPCDAMVQIQKSVGEPRILSTSGDKLSEVQSAEISVTYENVGEAEGSFEATVLQCGGPLTFSGTSKRTSLEPGERHTDSFVITGASSSDTQTSFTDSCEFQIKEIGTGETDTASANVEFSQKQTCTPKEKFRKTSTENGEVVYSVYQCNDAGTASSKVKTCEPGEVAKPQTNNEYICVSQTDQPIVDPPKPGCEPITLVSNPVGADLTAPNIPCKIGNAVSAAWTGVKVVAAFAALLVGYRFGRDTVTVLELGGVAKALGRDVRVKWVVGLFFGLLFAATSVVFLSNPVVKWGLILGAAAYAIGYSLLFGPGSFLKSLLPV